MLKKGLALLLSVLALQSTAFGANVQPHWADDYIKELNQEGIMTPSAANPYAPDDTISRGSFVETLWQAAGRPTAGLEPFSDVSPEDSYALAVAWAYEKGITTGKTDTTFAPHESLTREQAFSLLYRSMEALGSAQPNSSSLAIFEDNDTVSSYAKEPVGALYSAGIVSGDGANCLNPHSFVTYGETAKLLCTVLNDANLPKTDGFFNDAIFIGDSVSLKLNLYVTKQRKENTDFMGTCGFLTSGSLGSGNALWSVSNKSVHPSYNGKKQLIETSVAQSGAKKVFLMLGMNDIGLYGVEKSVKQLSTLIDRIKAASPDVSIYVQSVTPIYQGREKNTLNNENIVLYNRSVKEMCEKKGYPFLDVASVLMDENGYLKQGYCSDPQTMGIHFTDAACKVWIDYLKNTVQ